MDYLNRLTFIDILFWSNYGSTVSRINQLVSVNPVLLASTLAHRTGVSYLRYDTRTTTEYLSHVVVDTCWCVRCRAIFCCTHHRHLSRPYAASVVRINYGSIIRRCRAVVAHIVCAHVRVMRYEYQGDRESGGRIKCGWCVPHACVRSIIAVSGRAPMAVLIFNILFTPENNVSARVRRTSVHPFAGWSERTRQRQASVLGGCDDAALGGARAIAH